MSTTLTLYGYIYMYGAAVPSTHYGFPIRLGCNVKARVRRAAAVTAGLTMLPRARCGTFEMIRPRDVPLLTGYCTIGATARALLG